MDVKRHAFWIAMGAVGVVIVVLYVVLVVSTQSAAQTLQGELLAQENQLGQLKDAGDQLPTEAFAKAYREHKDAIAKQRDEVKLFYRDNGDSRLETWFEELRGKVSAGQQPTLGDFVPQYKDSTDKLVKYLEGAGIQVGPRKGKFDTASGDGGFELKVRDVNENNMKQLQKHFWIQKRLADVLVASRVQIFERIEFRDTTPTGPAAPSPGAGGDPLGPRTVLPNALVRDLGQAIPFELTVHLLHSDVPKLLSNLLKFEKSFPLMVRVRAFKVRKTQTPPEEKKINVPVEEMEKPGHKPADAEPIAVTVVIVGEALDFNIQ
ncbi:MAG: hypothetical protein HZA54_13960 [Planctomycetes bacterium]|nr:hypothetical protein [Planctomycetota bacterium]